MSLFARRRRLRVFLIIAVCAAAIVYRLFFWDGRPADVRDFVAVRDAWDSAVFGAPRSGRVLPFMSPPEPTEPLRGEQRRAAEQQLAEQCLQVAEKHPGTAGELAALLMASGRAPTLEPGRRARSLFLQRIKTAELSQLQQAIQLTQMQLDPDNAELVSDIAPALIQRIEAAADDPHGAALLAFLSIKLAAMSTSPSPPPHFQQVSDLLIAYHASSPDIYNYCESLGGMHASPPWAAEFEEHLRQILRVNQHRWVRCTASLALASVVQLSLDRQLEAEQLFEQFLRDFDGQQEYSAQGVELVMRERANERLLEMQFAPIGRTAPEIEADDLDGNLMRLSEYRGRVVLLTFWATWCYPCMKLIPHEQQLATELADEPFVVVGVNADYDEQALRAAIKKHGISWRSFRDKRSDEQSISDEWKALFPTVYLIDHNGIIRNRWNGTPQVETLDQAVRELVAAARAE